jgi:hypothetical protein
LIDVDPAHPIDGLLYGRHSILRSRFQGPRWIFPNVYYDVSWRKSPA